MILSPVKHLNIYHIRLRSPRNSRQVLFTTKIIRIQKSRLSRSYIINPKTHQLGFHSCHRIFDLPQSPHPGIDIQQREGSYLTFVLAIESKLFAIRRPENASRNSEFISANHLPVHDILVLVRGNGITIPTFVHVIQVIIDRVSIHITRFRISLVSSPFRESKFLFHLFLSNINMVDTPLTSYHQSVIIQPRKIRESSQFGSQDPVQFRHREQYTLFTFIDRFTHQTFPVQIGQLILVALPLNILGPGI